MKDFKSLIGASTKELRETRVKNVVRNTSAASKRKIEDDKQAFRDLQSKIENHMDLGITNTTDLASNLKDFDPSPWCNELYSMSRELALKAVDIKIKVNIHNKLFPDDKVEYLSDADLDFIQDTTGFSNMSNSDNNPIGINDPDKIID